MNMLKLQWRSVESKHLLVLFLAGLGLRVGYLLLAIKEFGFSRLCTYAADTSVYMMIADYLRFASPAGEEALLKVGPGYGLILLALQSIFGLGPIWPILLNILLGSLAPVAVYLLADRLIGSRRVALIAGGISCVSLTSISLSSQILSDQAYFTFQAFGLICFVSGFRTGKTYWFLLSGILVGWATYVRSAGEFWAYLLVLIALMVPTQRAFTSRRQMLRKSLLAGAVALAMLLGWSARNLVVHDVFTASTNGVYAVRGYLLNEAVCRHTPGCEWDKQGLAWSIEDGDRTQPPAVSYARAKARVMQIIRQHPQWVISTYAHLLDVNIRAVNNFLYQQIPSLESCSLAFYRAMRDWLAYLLVLASLAGVGLLLVDKQYLAASLLGVAYGYYTLISGLSFMQGTRLQYPAEMAWAILVAYVVVRAGDHSIRLFRLARDRRQVSLEATHHT